MLLVDEYQHILQRRVEFVKKVRVPQPEEQPTSELKEIAEALCTFYHEAIRSRVLDSTASGVVMKTPKLNSVDRYARLHFKRAAVICQSLGADPRHYIIAQFDRWVEMSKWHEKLLLPMPQNLDTTGAQVRYLQWHATHRQKRDRAVGPERSSSGFLREEKKLSGLVRVMRLAPEDILVDRPEEFTKEFLKHKKVWTFVKAKWLAHFTEE